MLASQRAACGLGTGPKAGPTTCPNHNDSILLCLSYPAHILLRSLLAPTVCAQAWLTNVHVVDGNLEPPPEPSIPAEYMRKRRKCDQASTGTST